MRPGRPLELPGRRIAAGTGLVHYSPEATDFAFAEANRRAAHLRVVHALQRPVLLPGGVSRIPSAEPDLRETENGARRFLEARIAELSARHPGVPVELRINWTDPATLLTELSDEVDLLVVGSRGRTGLRKLLLGSVSSEVLHTARCPVVVVPSLEDG